MVKYDFKGRLTAVTGGASGIGEAVCEAFAKNSSDVAVMDINEIAGRNLAADLIGKIQSEG